MTVRSFPEPSLVELRRRLSGLSGFTTASTAPTASTARFEPARIVPAELIEPAPLSARSVGGALPCPESVAFLDGTQRSELAGYVGAAPLLLAEVSAAVRARTGSTLRTVVVERRQLAVARPEVLAAIETDLPGVDTLALHSDEPAHPLGDVDLARALVDTARRELERRVGAEYRRRSEGWLIVDGSLAESSAWANDPRMLGVARSHATLPFEGDDLAAYLRLPCGCRSNLFQPASRERAPVYAWGLRLWEWDGKDLLFGLVRLEAAPTPATRAMADTLSRWILAERVPISSVAGWDRLLYGVHSVQAYLNASGAER